MDQLSNIAACRRTGRTTRILEKMKKSSFQNVVYLARTQEMSRYHMEMFIESLKPEGCCKCCQSFHGKAIEIIRSKMMVIVGSRTFYFKGEDTPDLFFKGLCNYDIHRDHTCYEV